MKSTQANQQSKAAIQSFLERQPDGETLSWLDVERATGVKMDSSGRGMVRTVLKAIGRTYESIRGSGIRLDSADNALAILGGRVRAIGGAVKRASQAHKCLSSRHLGEMHGTDKEKMINAGAFLGALAGVQANATRELAPPCKDSPKADPKIVLVR